MLSLIRKKKGFTLVELGASLGVVGTLALVNAQESGLATSQEKARAMGVEISTYNSAVSRFLAANAGDPSVAGGDPEIGSNWLKGGECDGGTASESFLPCEALPGGQTIQYGSVPTTTIKYSSEGALSARTVWTPVMGEEDSSNGMVMGLAALVASGNYISQHNNAASGYQYPTVYCPDVVDLSASIISICGLDRDAIISRAGLSSSVEPWLRTDHGNTMRHVIKFDGGGNVSPPSELKTAENRLVDPENSLGDSWLRQILGVSRIYNEFGEGGQSLTLGGRKGHEIYGEDFLTDNNLLNGAIVLDGNVGVMNDFYVKSDAFFSNIEATGNIRADGDLIGKKFVDADNNGFYVDPSDTSRVNVVDATSLESRGEVTGSLISSRGEVKGSLFRDITGDYYVDPSDTSRVNVVDATRLESRGEVKGSLFRDITGDYYVDPSSTSRVNIIDATRFRDINSSSRYIEPSGRSVINALDVKNTGNTALKVSGRIETDSLRITGNVSVGGNCTTGQIGTTSAGEILSCNQSSKWVKAAGGGGQWKFSDGASCGGHKTGTVACRTDWIGPFSRGRSIRSVCHGGAWIATNLTC